MLATLLLLAAALPQSPSAPRSPLTGGVVVAANGKPVSGANVTFVARLFPQSTEAGAVHRHDVETDAKGRFRIALDEGVQYSAWARWPSGATRCCEAVMSREFVELAQDLRCKPRTVVVEGLDAWPDHANFTMHAIVGSLNVDHVALPLRAGRVDVPALPASDPWLELRRGDGSILHVAQTIVENGKHVFVLPPPETYRVVVKKAGKPFAGAVVQHCMKWHQHAVCPAVQHPANVRCPAPIVARSGADGVALVVVPRHPKRLYLTVKAKGHAVEMIRVRDNGTPRVGDLQEGVTTDDGTIPIELRECRPQYATVGREFEHHVASGSAFVRVALGAMAEGLNDHGHLLDMIVPIVAGELMFDSALPEGTIVNFAVFEVHEEHKKRLERDYGTSVATWRSAYSRLLMDDDFDKTGLKGCIAVKVVAPGGMPVARAMVTTKNMIGDFNVQWTDRDGMVVLPSPAPHGESENGPSPRIIQAYGPFGLGATIVKKGQKTATVELVPIPQQKVRLVGKDGKPLVGEHVSARLGGFAEDAPLMSKAYWLLTYVHVTTDADGRAILPVLPSATEISFYGSCFIEGDELPWDPSKLKEVIEVVGHQYPPRKRK